jgi:hypothetical protein
MASVRSERPLVGAIRWDGWYGGSKGIVGKVVEECLSPKRYQHRAPFFSRVLSDDRIEIGPYTQEIVDREIEAAKKAGVDYWAYVAYDPNDPLSDGLKFHLSSRKSGDVRFAMILEAGRSGDAAAFPERMRRFVDLMRRRNYCRVAGTRPLFYIGFINDEHVQAWGGPQNARKLWDGFRAEARAAEVGDPYIVVMDFHPDRAARLANMIGADAVGAYAIPGDGGNESPYGDLRAAARRFWNEARDLGVAVVPTAMAGWDRRPRIERPHPWEPWQKPGEGMNRYYKAPTPDELASHVRECADWVVANPSVCPARVMLIYAWNEHDEGGWLCPTLGEGDARIEALARMWKQRSENALEGAPSFVGRFFKGKGDVEYLGLLDTARRMFAPDAEFQNVPMLYTPAWNGFVEGPTWGAWWIQNSYGTTYAALPFLTEPLTTFLQNSQDLWFDQMGDGKTVRPFREFQWVPPDGALCDAAAPGMFIAKQGDGRVDIHDWGMEFAAAGLLMQAELLLISRDADAIARYLPKLERTAGFLETRRDPRNNLYLAGPAGNLLAPSYAGWKKPDGTYGMAYLAGLSITTIAALDRLIELEKLAGNAEKAALYSRRRSASRKGLKALIEPDGYFVRSLDPDGVRHGVYGAERHGYFEAPPNHDAVCMRVADDKLARTIMDKIASIPGLRPHAFIIPNCPSYDDMYEKPEGLWAYGTWVNGGHWSTCEARMIIAYFRMGRFNDARRSMEKLLTFARRFRMDNPLTEFGNSVYQPNEPINTTYDAFGPPAAMVRGLFEYLYRADGVTLIPHVPPGVLQMEQRFPIRFGSKKLWVATVGSGPVTGVWVNGVRWRRHTKQSITLPYEATPEEARVVIAMGGAKADDAFLSARPDPAPSLDGPVPEELRDAVEDMRKRLAGLVSAGRGDSAEAAHMRLAIECAAAAGLRNRMKAEGKLTPLPPESARAADSLYRTTVLNLWQGVKGRAKF